MKILVLQLKRIGDLILTTPALVALRERYPEAEITLCMPEPYATLAPLLPGVNEVALFRQDGGNTHLWKRLALSKFDACLDFTGNDRSAFFTLLSKATRRIAFERGKQKNRFRNLFYNELVASSVRDRHTVDHYLDLLAPLDVSGSHSPITLCPSPAHEATAQRLLESHGITGSYAIVHPGTARAEKYWVPERWAEVIDATQERFGLPCLLTGTRQTYEAQHLEAITSRMRTPVRNIAGRAGLGDLAALIAGSRLLLSMDSAPVHFGAAFKVPQVNLFGLTNPYHWRARHEGAITLLAGVAGPVEAFSPSFPRRPVSDVSTEAVVDAIESLLPHAEA